MGKAVELNSSNFEQEVLQANVPVLVDFWAPWCGPCRLVAPAVEQLASEMAGQAKVGKLNVDEAPNLAAKYGISSIPALLIFKGGQVVNQFIGVQNKNRLHQALVDAAS